MATRIRRAWKIRAKRMRNFFFANRNNQACTFGSLDIQLSVSFMTSLQQQIYLIWDKRAIVKMIQSFRFSSILRKFRKFRKFLKLNESVDSVDESQTRLYWILRFAQDDGMQGE
jgi:hypothetical protein